MFLSIYTITEILPDGYRIHLDKENKVFKVHFEGNPVLPGACMTEIARELIELKYGKKLTIKNIRNLKFMQIISPEKHSEIMFTFELNETNENELHAKINVTDTSKETIFAKMSITLHHD